MLEDLTLALIAGDTNGRVTKRRKQNCIGRYYKGLANQNGERLMNLCELNNLKIEEILS